jgi:hypothetical protein
LKPSWKYFLSYETEWLTRDDIVDITYDSGQRLAEIKHKHGLIEKETKETILAKIQLARGLMVRIDQICNNVPDSECQQKLKELQLAMDRDSISTICEKEELKWPIWKSKLRYFNIIKAILFE